MDGKKEKGLPVNTIRANHDSVSVLVLCTFYKCDKIEC